MRAAACAGAAAACVQPVFATRPLSCTECTCTQCTTPPCGFDEGEASDICLPTGDDDEETSDGDSWGAIEHLESGAHAPGPLVPAVATAAAAPARVLAQADPAAAPLQRAQRPQRVMRAVLAAAPPVAAAAAPAAAPKPAKPRALAPKAAGIAKKAHPPPAEPVYGIGGSVPFSAAEKAEFRRAIDENRRPIKGVCIEGIAYAEIIRRALYTDDYPLLKLRVKPGSKVLGKQYRKMVRTGEMPRLV